MSQEVSVCAICGAKRVPGESWFMVAENRWIDKLRILHWSDHLARYREVKPVCSAAHVEELVAHWISRSSLDLAVPANRPNQSSAKYANTAAELDAASGTQVGELAIDRDSLQRVLAENPQSLRAILDAIMAALRRERPTRNRATMEGQEAFCVGSRSAFSEVHS